jgi:hypothetical protein
VRIDHADGRVSACSVVRDPENRDGLTQWIAVPPEGTLMDIGAGDTLAVDCMPPRSALSVDITAVVPPGFTPSDLTTYVDGWLNP